ncbi:MAG: DUF3494 domain-containing protein [Actinobacteria bacterium]|uniref:Unannotated protein n=1 Tax=freshwater metagenome TaxID=449393 RepID=A0A6J7G8Y0_9ZZZZ|nr:DUF3494 domain-containing protein [Actinomycetota bacterium]
MFASLSPAYANSADLQYTPDFGASISYAAVAGEALTLGADTSFQGNAGAHHKGAAIGSDEFNSALAVQSSINSLSSASIASELGGQILTPGVYSTDAALALTSLVTLDAQGASGAIFVIRTPAAMNTAAGAEVRLLNGAQAANVLWSIGGALTSGAGTTLQGHFYTGGAITTGAGTRTSGQLVAQAAITLGAGTTVTNDLAIPKPSLIWLNDLVSAASQGQEFRHELAVASSVSPTATETEATFVINAGLLPNGLQLDGDTGVITGVPTEAGVYTFDVSGNLDGHTGTSQTYVLTIRTAAVNTTPPITMSPTTPPAVASPSIPAANTPTAARPPAATTGASANTSGATAPTRVSAPNTSTTSNPSSAPKSAELASPSQQGSGSNPVGQSTNSYFADLTAVSIKLLQPNFFRGINAQEFASINPRAIAGLRAPQIRALAPNKFTRMTPRQFDYFSKAQIAVLSGRQLNALPLRTVDSISRVQLKALSKFAGSTLTPRSIAALNPKAVWSIPNSIYRKMTWSQQRAMKIAAGWIK